MKTSMRFSNRDEGVSEIFGTVLLLAVAVIIFSSLIVHVMSGPHGPDGMPSLQLVGRVVDDGGTAVIEHRGGDSLRLENIKVVLHLEDVATETIFFDSLGHAYSLDGQPLLDVIRGGSDGDSDELWEPGECLVYDGFNHDLDACLHTAVIDTTCNAVIMSGDIRNGIFTEYPQETMTNNGGGRT